MIGGPDRIKKNHFKIKVPARRVLERTCGKTLFEELNCELRKTKQHEKK